MSFFRYFVNRYEKEYSFLYKIIIILTTIAICIPVYGRYNVKYRAGGCAKDALITMTQSYTFPLLEILCVVIFIRLSLRDGNQNIVLRYGSKRKIWTYQSIAGFIYSIECVFLIYVTAIAAGYVFFGVYDKWQIEESLFYSMAKKRDYPTELPISDF